MREDIFFDILHHSTVLLLNCFVADSAHLYLRETKMHVTAANYTS